MSKQKIQKWVENAKPNESILYHTGHMAEERSSLEVREKANAFMLAAQQRKIDLFQNKVKEGSANHRPIYEYIAKKLKNERNKSIGQGR